MQEDALIMLSAHKINISSVARDGQFAWADARRIFDQQMAFSLVVLLALTLRCYCAMFLVGSIDTEGIEYARIGENLLAGNGYVGIGTPGEELMFPPLFPLLIAAVTIVTHQSEIAGRAISVIMGTLLIVPVYLITYKMYGRRRAQVASVLAACHPTLINISAAVYCESTYFTLIMGATYFVTCCASSGRRWHFTACGSTLGLAYLVRPEAVVYPLLFVLLINVTAWSADCKRLRTAALRDSLLLYVTFAIFAVPYIVWLSNQVGEFRLEGKGALNFAITEALSEGQTEEMAMYGIDQDLRGRGVWMRSNLDVIQSVKYDPKEIISIVRSNTIKNILSAITDIASGEFFGCPILWVLVILGLFGRCWNRDTRRIQPYLFTAAGVPLLASVTISHAQLQARYFLLLLPIMIIWASKGLSHLSRWVETAIRTKGRRVVTSRRIAIAVASAAAAAVLLVAAKGIEDDQFLSAFGRSSLPVKVAGEWLRTFTPGPITVMDASAILAYHAKASFLFYPQTDEATALRYIGAKGVNFLVLQEKWLPHTSYAHAWLTAGIPSPNARLVYSVNTPGRGRIVIYQLTTRPAG